MFFNLKQTFKKGLNKLGLETCNWLKNILK